MYNPVAYERAKQARIHANASKGRAKRLAEALAGEPDLEAWLHGVPTREEQASIPEGLCDHGDNGVCDVAMETGRCPWYKAWDAFVVARTHRLGALPPLLRHALQQWGGLTDGQLAFARRIYAERIERAATRETKRAAEAATALPWEAGRQQVEGVVLTVKSQESQWGWSIRVLVKRDDGSKLWCSAPRTGDALGDGLKVGDRVAFSVDVTPKVGEPTFAFGKRPTKGRIVARGA